MKIVYKVNSSCVNSKKLNYCDGILVILVFKVMIFNGDYSGVNMF